MGITWAVYIGFCWSGQSKNTGKNSRADNAIPIASAAMSL
jgi:hypothetical protein